jgi:hypothetical protein
VHPREHDLVIGTHGRGAWIIDDIRPLRALTREANIRDRNLHLFDVPTAIQHTRGISGPFYFPGDTRYMGPNRPYGALISYWVSAAAAARADSAAPPDTTVQVATQSFMPTPESGGRGPAVIEVMEGDSVIRTLKGPAKAGINRISWALERKGIRQPGAAADAPEPGGPEVLPGRYAVRVKLGDDVVTGALDVLQDPRTDRPLVAMRQNFDAVMQGQQITARLRSARDQLDRTKSALDVYGRELKRWETGDSAARTRLMERTDSVKAHVSRLLDRLRVPPDAKGIVADTTVTSRVQEAIGRATSTPDAPAPGRIAQLNWNVARADAVLQEIDRFMKEEIPEYREALRTAGFELLGGR